jgi:PAS domain S-box-containing protein
VPTERETASWLAAVAAGIDELVFVTEPSGRMLWANDALERHTGFTVADFQFRQPDNPFLHPDDAARVGAFIAAFAAGDAARSGPIENRFFDRWGQIHAYRSELWRVEADGAPALLFVCSRLSIDEPGGSAGAEASYRALVERALDPIVKLDAGGQLLYASPRLHELLGYAPAELAGRRLADLAQDPELAGMLFTENGRFPLRLVGKEGAVHECEISAGPLGDGGVIAVVRDVSEARQLREQHTQALERANHELRERMRAEEELRKSQDELRQSQKLEAIGRLAGGVAHDFNNMLGAILAFAALIDRKRPDDAILREDVGQIRLAAERAARLTHQLLAFSRRQVLKPVPLDVAAVVRDMAEMLQTLVGEAVALRVEATQACPVRVDRGQLEQVILNLTVNARDAMARGGTLTIAVDHVRASSLGGDLPAGDWARLVVADEGLGISADEAPHIFEPFFSTKPRGTGLGLSTVHGVVQQSSGEVRVHSRPGHGTTIEVYLPSVPAAELVAPRPPTPSPIGCEVVLLVEDEPLIRTAIERTLRDAGHPVLVADGPVAAQALAAEHDGPIDVLLTDFAMPGMNGRELCGRVRALRPHCRAIVMSGYASHDEAGAELGVEFLAKPFTLDALLALLATDAPQR